MSIVLQGFIVLHLSKTLTHLIVGVNLQEICDRAGPAIILRGIQSHGIGI